MHLRRAELTNHKGGHREPMGSEIGNAAYTSHRFADGFHRLEHVPLLVAPHKREHMNAMLFCKDANVVEHAHSAAVPMQHRGIGGHYQNVHWVRPGMSRSPTT